MFINNVWKFASEINQNYNKIAFDSFKPLVLINNFSKLRHRLKKINIGKKLLKSFLLTYLHSFPMYSYT